MAARWPDRDGLRVAFFLIGFHVALGLVLTIAIVLNSDEPMRTLERAPGVWAEVLAAVVLFVGGCFVLRWLWFLVVWGDTLDGLWHRRFSPVIVVGIYLVPLWIVGSFGIDTEVITSRVGPYFIAITVIIAGRVLVFEEKHRPCAQEGLHRVRDRGRGANVRPLQPVDLQRR